MEAPPHHKSGSTSPPQHLWTISLQKPGVQETHYPLSDVQRGLPPASWAWGVWSRTSPALIHHLQASTGEQMGLV